jgi:hypothetical protein
MSSGAARERPSQLDRTEECGSFLTWAIYRRAFAILQTEQRNKHNDGDPTVRGHIVYQSVRLPLTSCHSSLVSFPCSTMN